jgi:hypothetical protein
MPENDPLFHERALRRIARLIVAIGLIGALGAGVWRGAATGFSFLLGAAGSYASYWGWQQVAAAISPGAKPRSSRFFVLRLLLVIAAAWVIIRFLGLKVAAAVAGLLVSAAAILLEIIYELIYAS